MTRSFQILTLLVLLCACSGGGAGAERTRSSQGEWVRAPLGYSVRGSVRVGGSGADSVTFHIEVRNFGPGPAQYTPEACEVAARAYRAPRAGGAAVWESLRIHDVDCSGVGVDRTLAVGESTRAGDHWDLVLPVAAILGDSLPPGRYEFSVSSPLETFPDRRDALFVPAGAVDLGR